MCKVGPFYQFNLNSLNQFDATYLEWSKTKFHFQFELAQACFRWRFKPFWENFCIKVKWNPHWTPCTYLFTELPVHCTYFVIEHPVNCTYFVIKHPVHCTYFPWSITQDIYDSPSALIIVGMQMFYRSGPRWNNIMRDEGVAGQGLLGLITSNWHERAAFQSVGVQVVNWQRH